MRITKAQIKTRLRNLNCLLRDNGIKREYDLIGMYGYYALKYNQDSSTLQSGLSLKEADLIIQGMFEILYIKLTD